MSHEKANFVKSNFQYDWIRKQYYYGLNISAPSAQYTTIYELVLKQTNIYEGDRKFEHV